MQLVNEARRGRGFAVASAVALAVLTGCTSGNSRSGDGAATSATGAKGGVPASAGSSTTPAAPTNVAFTNSAQGQKVSPADPVTISVTDAKLTSVTMKNPAGKAVDGAISADGASWSNHEVLGYGKTYRVIAVAQTADGRAVTKRTKVRTVSPFNLTQPNIDTIYGSPIKNGERYGVGMVVNVAFDEPITDKAAAERAFSVETKPAVTGAWYWVDPSHARWRPKRFYESGTKVTVKVNVYGKDLGNGLYGQADKEVSFKIGRKQITIVRDTAPAKVNKVRVFNADGKVLRTMNTAMGMHGGQTTNGTYFNFYTLDGTYTVLGHENPATMSSDSYGLPSNAANGYPPEKVPYATKISTDGIYLHYLNTEWAQDSGQDISHGCLNLNWDNAVWFYNHSKVGDPVIIHGASGAPKIEVWQGGDWSLPWAKWKKGSALS